MQSQCSTLPFKCPEAIHLRPYLRFFVCLLTLGQRGLAHIFSHGNRGNFSLQRKQVDPNLLVVPLATYKLSKRGNCCTHSTFAIQAMLPMDSERQISNHKSPTIPSKYYYYPKSYYRKLESRRRKKEGMHLCSYNKGNRAITFTLQYYIELCLLLTVAT